MPNVNYISRQNYNNIYQNGNVYQPSIQQNQMINSNTRPISIDTTSYNNSSIKAMQMAPRNQNGEYYYRWYIILASYISFIDIFFIMVIADGK